MVVNTAVTKINEQQKSTTKFTMTASTTISAGQGLIHAKLLPPSRLALQALNFRYPLKLISPAPSRTAKCLIVFMLSYGGGLVSGDVVDLKIVVEDGAKICLQTQGSTKVFKRKPFNAPSPNLSSPTPMILTPTDMTRQHISATLYPNSSLILLPDPIQPFGESSYSQRQTFRMLSPATTSLLVLDWVTEGRGAVGERWKLTRFETRSELWDASSSSSGLEGKGRLMLRDAMVLQGDDDMDDVQGGESLFGRQDGQTCFATLIIHGPKFASLAEYVRQSYRAEPRIGAKKWDDDDEGDADMGTAVEGIMWTTSSVRGCQVVKVSGRDVETVKDFIRGLLVEGKGGGEDDESEDDDEVGCIEREFGRACMRCVEV